ncbi:hypothetical protein BH23BAC3_BH23BAC3_15120 [soil metagenome]
MIQKIRKTIPYLLPVIAVILIVGLILSRVVNTDSTPADPDVSITAFEAQDYLGTFAEVCGVVASADYLANVSGQPTFLNLDEPYPDHIFTAIIFGENRNRFRIPPEQEYLNQNICVTGTIRLHEGLPQIVVSDPEQISLSEPSE